MTARPAGATLADMASSTRIPYPQASRALLRDSVLDAMRDLVTEKDWSEVTMSQVATAAGLSRQTVYNEFKSRPGLAQAYALRLVDRFVEVVGAAVYRHPGSVRKALVDGFTDFFTLSAADPLVKSLLTGEAKPDLPRPGFSAGGSSGSP